jgi:hypothetical protein
MSFFLETRHRELTTTMPLTKAERSAINRKNRTVHGMRGSAEPLEDEREETQATRAEWFQFFKPRDPLQRANVERALDAEILRRRGKRYYTATVDRQRRNAKRRFDAAQNRRVVQLAAGLKTDPKMTVLLLKESAAGCRYLIKYWNSICIQFDRGELWFSESQCDDALRLLGHQPEEKRDDNVYSVRMMNYGASPEACAEGWAWWLDRKRIPDAVLRHLDNQMPLPEECRDTLKQIVTGEREALEELEAELREIEDADRAEATERALVLKGKKAALWDRYQRMNTSSHHRAERSLKEGLRRPLEPAPGEWNERDTAGPAVAPPDAEASQEVDLVTVGPDVPLDPEPGPPPASGAAGAGPRPVVDIEPVPDEHAVLCADVDTPTAQVCNLQEDTTTILANQNAPKEIGSDPSKPAAAGVSADSPEPSEWLQAHLESRQRLLWGRIEAAARPAARDPAALPGDGPPSG